MEPGRRTISRRSTEFGWSRATCAPDRPAACHTTPEQKRTRRKQRIQAETTRTRQQDRHVCGACSLLATDKWAHCEPGKASFERVWQEGERHAKPPGKSILH